MRSERPHRGWEGEPGYSGPPPTRLGLAVVVLVILLLVLGWGWLTWG